MTTLRDAAQQALEALEWHLARGTWGADLEGCAANLRAALEQAEPVQEPVAWQSMQVGIPVSETHDPEEAQKWRDSGVPVRALYAALPQRKPLTDDELAEVLALWDHWIKRTTLTHIARAIERAHGIEEET